jgi:hypothetical protein
MKDKMQDVAVPELEAVDGGGLFYDLGWWVAKALKLSGTEMADADPDWIQHNMMGN